MIEVDNITPLSKEPLGIGAAKVLMICLIATKVAGR